MEKPKVEISVESLLLSNVILTNAILQLLVAKGIITPQELDGAIKTESLKVRKDTYTGNVN